MSKLEKYRYENLSDTYHFQKQPPQVLYKKVLKYFANFAGKHLCQSLFFTKAAGFLAFNFIKETLAQVLSCEFWEIFKTPFLQNTSGRVLPHL